MRRRRAATGPSATSTSTRCVRRRRRSALCREAAGIPTVGPSREAAQLETNKEFTRDLMRDHGIPGAPRSWAFGDLDAFSDFVKASDFEFVIKPLGLTGGKGVRVWGDHFATKEEGLAYGREILEKKIGGVARFLVEEKLVGEE